jgi:hypothetical protein
MTSHHQLELKDETLLSQILQSLQSSCSTRPCSVLIIQVDDFIQTDCKISLGTALLPLPDFLRSRFLFTHSTTPSGLVERSISAVMSDLPPRPPRILPRRRLPQQHWDVQGSTFIDPRGVGTHPNTLQSPIPEAYSDQGNPPSTAGLNQRSTVSGKFAKSGLSAGSGPSTEAGPSTGVRPSKTPRIQPSAPNNTSMRPPPTRTTQHGHQSRSTDVLRSHCTPALGSAERASPPASGGPAGRGGAAKRVIAAPEATHTNGRHSSPSDPWEVMLVNSIMDLEQTVDDSIKELICLKKGQPPRNPRYRGMNWADTYEAASHTLDEAIHKIESYERELRKRGVITRLPGPGRFRLDLIPPVPGGHSYEVGGPGAGGPGALGGGPGGPQGGGSRAGTTWGQGRDPVEELRSLLASSRG